MFWYFTDVPKPGRQCCYSRSSLPVHFLPDALPVLLLLCHYPFQAKIPPFCISLLISGHSHLNLALLKLKTKQTNPKVLQQHAHLDSFKTVLSQDHFSPSLCLLLPFLPTEQHYCHFLLGCQPYWNCQLRRSRTLLSCLSLNGCANQRGCITTAAANAVL